MARPAYTEEQVNASRREIAKAAIRVFERDGSAAVTMRSIARELGRSAGLPYAYFQSKDEILAFVRAEGFERLSDRFEEAVVRAGDPVRAIRGIAEAYLRFSVESPDLYDAMFSLKQGDLAAHAEVRATREKAFQTAQGVTARAIADGSLTGDARTLTHLLWIALHGLATLELAHQLDQGMVFGELMRPVVDNWIQASRSPEESS